MKNYLLTSSGRGKDITDLLMKELGLPATTCSFSVHFPVDGLITVTCEYAPLESMKAEKLPEHPCG